MKFRFDKKKLSLKSEKKRENYTYLEVNMSYSV